MKNKNKNETRKRVVRDIIIIIIIILLLLTSCSIYNGIKKPGSGGNGPDIIDIDCTKTDCKPTNPDKPDKPDTPAQPDKPDKPSNPTKPSNPSNPSNPTTPVEEDGKFEALESGKSWETINNLKIFANPMYNMEEKIAPESSNTYQFIVRNNTKYNLVYQLRFNETNEFNINMKYRLKREDTYVAGDENTWVKADDIYITDLSINKSSKDTYYLEWKWFSSDNDTEIGKQKNAGYKLDIDIKAESVE